MILKDAVTECDVFLAIMGKNWVEAADQHTGQRRLLDPNDFVRIEVETALQNNRTKVIPVIAHDAQIPQSGELPEPIRELVKLQFVRVRCNPDFHRDMDKSGQYRSGVPAQGTANLTACIFGEYCGGGGAGWPGMCRPVYLVEGGLSGYCRLCQRKSRGYVLA